MWNRKCRLSPITFGNQTISLLSRAKIDSRQEASKRFTALRPCLATGLPLSGAIFALRKITRCSVRRRVAADPLIKLYLYLFVKVFMPISRSLARPLARLR